MESRTQVAEYYLMNPNRLPLQSSLYYFLVNPAKDTDGPRNSFGRSCVTEVLGYAAHPTDVGPRPVRQG